MGSMDASVILEPPSFITKIELFNTETFQMSDLPFRTKLKHFLIGPGVNRKGIDYRLVEYTFGEIQFDNFCPYFWLRNAMLLALPFVAAFKGSKRLFYYLTEVFEGLLTVINKYLCVPLSNKALEYLPVEKAMKLYEQSADYWMKKYEHYSKEDAEDVVRYMNKEKENSKFQAWKARHPDWKKMFEDTEQRLKREKEELKKAEVERKKFEAEAKDRRKQRQLKVATVCKKIFPIAMAVVGLVVFAVVVKIVLFLAAVIVLVDWVKVGHALLILLCVLAGIVAICGVVYTIVKLIEKCTISIPTPNLGPLAAPFRWIRDFFVIVGRGLKSAAEFTVELVVEFKKDHCPKIEWLGEE